MTTHRRPPVIPEIAKAYTNDPRTQLALKALAAGSSTAPVAQGKYGMGDGVARIAQALIGAKLDNSTQDQYGKDEADLLALRKARGVDGLNGAPGPAPASAPAVAAALGAPAPPPVAPIAAPGLPTAPLPPPGATLAPPPPVAAPGPPVAPPVGGGPNGRPPFGPSVAAKGPAFLAPPTVEAVPDAPATVAKPVRPDAVGPTKSRMLNAAYRIMSDANPYESAQGQDMYTEGLTDQTKLDENASERKQHMIDAEYGTERELYANAASQDRASVIHGREDVIAANRAALKDFKDKTFEYGVHKEDQSFQASEKAKDRANAVGIERMKLSAEADRAADLTPAEQQALTKAALEGRVDVSRETKYNRKQLAQTFLANPNFDAMTNHGAAQLAANAPAMQKAMMASSLPSVLANVRDAGKKINLSDAQFIGKLQAWGKGQVNDPNFIAYMNNRNDAMMMIAQVMRGTGATDKAVALENDAAPKSMSPRAWDAWYEAQMKSLAPRVKIMEQRKLLPEGTSASMAGTTTAPGVPAPSSDGWGKASVVGR